MRAKKVNVLSRFAINKYYQGGSTMSHRSLKTNHLIVFIALLCLLLGFGYVQAAEKVIKIGTLFPLTGPVATAGQRCQAVGVVGAWLPL